jgi:hypothetical protein
MKEVITVKEGSKQRQREAKGWNKAPEDAIESRSLAQDDQLLNLLNAAW